jgi:hypothetical protein
MPPAFQLAGPGNDGKLPVVADLDLGMRADPDHGMGMAGGVNCHILSLRLRGLEIKSVVLANGKLFTFRKL